MLRFNMPFFIWKPSTRSLYSKRETKYKDVSARCCKATFTISCPCGSIRTAIRLSMIVQILGQALKAPVEQLKVSCCLLRLRVCCIPVHILKF